MRHATGVDSLCVNVCNTGSHDGESIQAMTPHDQDAARKEQMNREALEKLGRLHNEQVAAGGLSGRMQEQVDIARSTGSSWRDIGAALGISRWGAQKRFGKTTQ